MTGFSLSPAASGNFTFHLAGDDVATGVDPPGLSVALRAGIAFLRI